MDLVLSIGFFGSSSSLGTEDWGRGFWFGDPPGRWPPWASLSPPPGCCVCCPWRPDGFPLADSRPGSGRGRGEPCAARWLAWPGSLDEDSDELAERSSDEVC